MAHVYRFLVFSVSRNRLTFLCLFHGLHLSIHLVRHHVHVVNLFDCGDSCVMSVYFVDPLAHPQLDFGGLLEWLRLPGLEMPQWTQVFR